MNEDLNLIGKGSELYKGNPYVQSLAKLIPFWGSVDTFLVYRASQIERERLHTFFQELANGNLELTKELTESEDFLHMFFSTSRAAKRTRRREKIKLFAKLLLGAVKENFLSSIDEYEELWQVLEMVSYREFAILKHLYDLEKLHPVQSNKNDIENAWSYWGQFRTDIEAKFGLPKESFLAFMSKTQRTGLYLRMPGGALSYAGDMGKTTPLMKRLLDLVHKNGVRS